MPIPLRIPGGPSILELRGRGRGAGQVSGVPFSGGKTLLLPASGPAWGPILPDSLAPHAS